MIHEDEAFKKQFDWPTTKRILGYLKPYRHLVIGALLLALGVAATSQSYPRLQAFIIDNYLAPRRLTATPEERLHGVLIVAMLYMAVAIVEFMVRFGFQYLLTWMGQNILFDIRADIFGKLQRLPLAYFDRNPVGRLITRVTSDVDAINQFITNGLVTMAQSVFILAVVLGFMLALDWRLTLIAVAVIPVIFAASRFFQVRMRNSYRLTRIRQAIVNTYLNENITGMFTVQLFNRENRNKQSFDRVNRDFMNANLESVKWFSMFFPTVGFLANAAMAAVVWYGGGRTIQGFVTIGTLFAFTQYVRNFFNPLQDLSDVFNNLQAAMASAERIFGVLDEVETVADPAQPRLIEHFAGSVEFRDVWFAYTPVGVTPKETDFVLRGINFNVHPGESVAFVGATGAGKTSVISLISRFYDVQRGAVLVDGHDVREYAQQDLRKHIGVVLQDVFLFAGTISSNLKMNDDTIPMDRVIQACKYVGVHEFIVSLPSGYDTEVRERGATLSTGQKQLLAFARALIQNPDIVLVLDEATANVDTETELQIQDAQAKLMHGRTSIIIAHRLSTIKHCDRIIVMRKGRIVEQGSHDALLRQDGYYSRLYRLQYADQEAVTP